jgi:tRNA (guanine-N7-)-methyltransferase
MKPRDLKFPFIWEKRKPLICDQVFFIPKRYDHSTDAHFSLFERTAPIWIEYCSGNGAWIIENAKAHPERNWIAVEKRFDRVQKIWSKMKNQKIENLLIVCGQAQDFTSFYTLSNSIEGIYINFPDPWPKSRHAKHRLIQKDFICQLARVCKNEAPAVVVTDHEDYVERICNEFLTHPSWKPVFPSPYFITEWDGYGSSYFDELWRNRGKTIHYLQFSNVHCIKG